MLNESNDHVTSHTRYLLYIAILLVAVLIISNTVAGKLVQIGAFVVSGAIIIFPVSYIFGDVLTEVYGYKASRRVVWSGFGALALMSLVYWLVQIMPGASFWENQSAYDAVLGSVPRIAFGSITAYLCGEFVNSYVLSRMKIMTAGRHLWARTIGSTIFGEGIDTLVFFTIAFVGVIPTTALVTAMVSSYVLKVSYEILATPITYKVVAALKRAEGIDVYDRGISYNPFILAD